jgi:hypothetical protein
VSETVSTTYLFLRSRAEVAAAKPEDIQASIRAWVTDTEAAQASCLATTGHKWNKAGVCCNLCRALNPKSKVKNPPWVDTEPDSVRDKYV